MQNTQEDDPRMWVVYSLGRRGEEDEEEGKGRNASHLVWDLF
jgi:hypothetical protein